MQLKVVVDGIEYAPVNKPNKWKLPEYEDGEDWIISGSNQVAHKNSKNFTSSGRRRATKELAERCAKMSKQRDLLEAWRDHLDPEWIDKEDYTVHYIYYSDGKYKISVPASIRAIGTVYMGKQTAKEICQALNSKELIL